jgi:hypothetical protein
MNTIIYLHSKSFISVLFPLIVYVRSNLRIFSNSILECLLVILYLTNRIDFELFKTDIDKISYPFELLTTLHNHPSDVLWPHWSSTIIAQDPATFVIRIAQSPVDGWFPTHKIIHPLP